MDTIAPAWLWAVFVCAVIAALFIDFVVLMWVGAQTPTELTSWISLVASAYWFAYFLVILPLLGIIEKPLPQPATIEDDFNAHYSASSHAAVALIVIDVLIAARSIPSNNFFMSSR